MPFKRLQLLVFLALAGAVLQAQTSSPANPQTAAQDSSQTNPQAASQPPAQPAHADGEGPQLAVESDPEYKNVLVGNVMAGASFDNHALESEKTPGTYTSDALFFVQPSIAFQETKSTVNWTASYTPGVSIDQHSINNYQYTQNAGGELGWQPSSHVRLRLRQDYTVTTNPFETVGREPVMPTLGGFTGPTSSDILPFVKRTFLVSNAEVTARLSPHSALGFTGSYQQFDYANLPENIAPLTLTSSHTVLGTAFYSQQISSRTTVGVQYALFDIYSDLTGGEARAQAQDVQLYGSWRLSGRSTFSVYAGPEYSRDFYPGLPGITHYWRPSAGVTYAWNGSRNAVTLDYVRRTSDGGGLMGATLTNHGVAGVRSRLTKNWNFDLRFEATDQIATEGFIEFRTYWAGAGVDRDLGRNFSLRLDYARLNQNSYESPGTPQEVLAEFGNLLLKGNHNLVQFSINLHFLKPLGW